LLVFTFTEVARVLCLSELQLFGQFIYFSFAYIALIALKRANVTSLEGAFDLAITNILKLHGIFQVRKVEFV
jgi:hypothetical protein